MKRTAMEYPTIWEGKMVAAKQYAETKMPMKSLRMPANANTSASVFWITNRVMRFTSTARAMLIPNVDAPRSAKVFAPIRLISKKKAAGASATAQAGAEYESSVAASSSCLPLSERCSKTTLTPSDSCATASVMMPATVTFTSPATANSTPVEITLTIFRCTQFSEMRPKATCSTDTSTGFNALAMTTTWALLSWRAWFWPPMAMACRRAIGRKACRQSLRPEKLPALGMIRLTTSPGAAARRVQSRPPRDAWCRSTRVNGKGKAPVL
mmetsp:Transcript_77232/g.239222  ORF Transcript_77232/g.239222 Transcript_77232/m.239222 type:complete len:268 (+) Transcript_77232:307-1110(+)